MSECVKCVAQLIKCFDQCVFVYFYSDIYLLSLWMTLD